MSIIIDLIGCIAAVFLMGQIMPNLVHYDSVPALLASGAILWLVNILIRPFLKLIALPLTVITLGLFSLVINTLMVMLTDVLVPGVDFGGFLPSLLLAILVSLLQIILSKIFTERHD